MKNECKKKKPSLKTAKYLDLLSSMKKFAPSKQNLKRPKPLLSIFHKFCKQKKHITFIFSRLLLDIFLVKAFPFRLIALIRKLSLSHPISDPPTLSKIELLTDSLKPGSHLNPILSTKCPECQHQLFPIEFLQLRCCCLFKINIGKTKTKKFT